MEILVYSIPNCKYCKYTKELFERAGVSWEEILCINENDGRLKKDYPDANSYPYVVIDGEVVGGLTETAKYFLENDLVSPRKK
jgi:glutaredoxin